MITGAIIFIMWLIGSTMEPRSKPLTDREQIQAGADQIDAYCASSADC